MYKRPKDHKTHKRKIRVVKGKSFFFFFSYFLNTKYSAQEIKNKKFGEKSSLNFLISVRTREILKELPNRTKDFVDRTWKNIKC